MYIYIIYVQYIYLDQRVLFVCYFPSVCSVFFFGKSNLLRPEKNTETCSVGSHEGGALGSAPNESGLAGRPVEGGWKVKIPWFIRLYIYIHPRWPNGGWLPWDFFQPTTVRCQTYPRNLVGFFVEMERRIYREYELDCYGLYHRTVKSQHWFTSKTFDATGFLKAKSTEWLVDGQCLWLCIFGIPYERDYC